MGGSSSRLRARPALTWSKEPCQEARPPAAAAWSPVELSVRFQDQHEHASSYDFCYILQQQVAIVNINIAYFANHFSKYARI